MSGLEKAPANENLIDFLGQATNKELAVFAVALSLAVLLLYFFQKLIGKFPMVFSCRFPAYAKFANSSNWVEVDAKVIRLDYANMEGGPIRTKELANLDPEYFITHGADPVVAVVEYPNSLNGKMTPVIINPAGKALKPGQEIVIKYNPKNPLEAVFHSLKNEPL